MKNKTFIIFLCLFIAFGGIVAVAENMTESGVEIVMPIATPEPTPIPELSVYIYKDPLPIVCPVDTLVVFHSVLTNAEYYTNFQYQWMRSYDEETWEEIPGATEDTYSTPVAENKQITYYKLVVYYMDKDIE